MDDDETASLVLSKTSLDPVEGDTTGQSYTVKLSHVPVETITVTLSGHSGTDLALTGPTSDKLTFTSSDWDTAQTVTVKAAQDDDAVNDKETLTHTGEGGAYKGLTRDLTVTVDDDDEAGIVLSKASLGPAEGNSSGESYTVRLSSEPTATITVTITGHSDTDLTLSGPTGDELTFTSSNWNAAQTVTVKAAQDDDAVNEKVTLTHTGEGGDYEGLTRELPVTVEDDESPHLVFSKTSLPVNEGETGGASYTVKLGTQPTASTTVTITGHSGTDLTLTGPTSDELTFTSSNWNTAQTVTVKAAQDADAYGDTATLTHTATGGDYQGVVKELTVTVEDDEEASIVLSKTSLGPEEGSSTGESYTVKLSHVPTATITITISGHSNSDLVVDKETLTFTTVDWDTAQTVMVTASHDDDAVSDQVTLTHTGAGEEYQGLTKALKVTVIEDEEYGVKVAPIAIAVVAGGKNDYTVKLASQPAGEVTVTVSGQAGSDLTLTGLTNNTLTFTSSNWNTAQTVSVSATGSAAAADVTLSHAASSAADSDYNGLAGDALGVTVIAKAANALVIQPGVTTLNQKLTVDEGDSGTYAIVLSHVPSGDVTFTVDDPTDNTDVTAEPASLLFSTSNWNIAQDVTVTAAEDDDASADPVATVKHSVSGGGYDDVTVPDAVVTIKENDSPALVLSKNSLTLEEADTTGGSYTVRLATSPSDTVTVTVGGHSGTDLSLSGVSASNTLTFTTSNWNTTQTITVTAGEDPDASDDKATLTHTASGGDYGGAPPETLSVSVTDDDRPRLSLSKKSISPEEGSPTGESYTVELATQPTQTVTVTIGGHSGTDLSLDKSSLVFTATNWDAPQTVAVTAAEDEDAVDDEETLNHSASGGDYETVEESLAVTVTDTSDMTVSFDSATYSATEGGSNATVTVQLNAPAPAQLVVPIAAEPVGETEASDWEGIPEQLTFETGETTKSFMVIAFDDDIEDDGEMVKLGFGTLPEGWVAGSNATAEITLINDDTPQGTFTLACEEAAWCAELQLADYTALDWAWLWLLYKAFWDPPSTISQASFTFRSEGYAIRNIDVFAGMFPGVDNLWGRSFFDEATLDVKITRGKAWDTPPREHYRDWVLHLDGLKLPFSQATLSGTSFRWTGPEVQRFYLDWTESEITRIGIEETPLADQPTAPIPSPRFVTVTPASASQLSVAWQASRQGAGFGQVKSYEVQWKAATAAWSDATAVSEARVANDRTKYTMSLTGLLENEFYAVRVIATGTTDQSPPSPEVIAKPQPYSPKMLSAVVNGRTLTMRFDRELNTSAVPPPSSFVVLVEGGLREVDSVSIVSSGQPGASNDAVQLTLKRPVSAANTVKARYDAPLDPTANFLSDVFNRYVPYSGLWSAQHATTNETDPAALQPLTANFTNVPDSHDGQNSVTFNIEFSESAWVGVGLPMYNLLQVQGGAVTASHWLDRRTEKWEVTIQPVDDEDIVVVMPDNRRCSGIQPELGAPCAAGGRELTNRPEVTIPGPRSLLETSNTSATGGPGIDGFPVLGQTLTATTSGIADEDGMTGAVFAYQWIRRDLATDTETNIEGATGLTYTVTAEDEGKGLRVRVTFTDDAGNEESVTSYLASASPALIIPDEDVANTSATGGPGIDGFPVLGQTLTATTSGIADEDGMTGAVFAYQWIRRDLATDTETNIEGATGLTYTVTAEDEGKGLRVRVTFTDDAGNEESVTSAATAAVKQPLTASVDGAPESHDGQSAFTFELEFSEEPKTGFSYVTLRDHAFTVTGGTVTNTRRLEPGKNDLWEITVQPDGNADVTVSLPATTDCDAQGAVCTSDSRMLSTALELVTPGPSSQQPLQVNSAATGGPTITGTARVGETLTANTSGIADSDGLSNATFSHQWLADGTAISDATGSSYTLANDDVGKTLKVRVTFSDDGGHEESLTSVATDAVAAANSPATGDPTITGTAQVGETLTANTSGIADADGLTNATFTYRWLADDADISGATGSSYTLTPSVQGNAIKVRVTFTDDNGNQETLTSVATDAVAAANSAATGAPTITGTAQVGETLITATTAIADADGLTNVTFAYRWLADDAEISGATGSSYTLTSSVQGKAIKVRVTFTDDAGHEESVTSAATAAVAAAPSPLTASVHSVPASHDGSASFTFELRFSETPKTSFSYRTLRDHAFTVTGGEVVKAERLEHGKNVRWEITVQPSSNAGVTIVLPVTTDCASQGAVCTEDGRMLSEKVELTVDGPSG